MPCTPYTFKCIVDTIIGLIQGAIPIVFGLIVLATLVGGTFLIYNAGNEEQAKKGKQVLFWGVVVLVVAVGLWSIVRIIQTTFGLR